MQVQTRESLTVERRLSVALELIRNEALRAFEKHGPISSPHEAFGILYEELNIEFGNAMHANDLEQQLQEMIQVGAMAARAMVDLYAIPVPQPEKKFRRSGSYW